MEKKVYKLGSVCLKIGSGATPTGGKEAYKGGGYKLIRSQNVMDLRFSYDGLAEINKEQAVKLNNVQVEANDVLLNITGDSVARCCMAPANILPARVNQHVSIIRPNGSLLNPYYLLFWLIVNKQYLLALAATGATRNALTKSMIKGLVVACPSIERQHRIASILSTYDTLIENNTKRIRLLEKMAENLYKEWFVRFRFPGHEKVEMVNGLPKGWKISKIKDFGRIETGKTPSTKKTDYYGGEILFIKTPDMHDGIFVTETEETLSVLGSKSQSKKLLPPNSIMVSCIGTGGVVAINAKLGHTNQQINSIVLERQTDLEWLFFVCKSLKPTIELFGATGATMTNLSKGKFERLKIIEPIEKLRSMFNDKVAPIFKLILKLKEQNTLLARQRDLLLPRLMSGKLEVNS